MIVQICVGSSCHIKGSQKIIGLMQDAVSKYGLDGDITLAGCFCSGRCNRTGVTITVDDDVYAGITEENFDNFFRERILSEIKSDGQ